MKYLLTGATGFLGRHLLKHRTEGVQWIPAARKQEDIDLFHEEHKEARRFDLHDPDGMREAVRGCDGVVHLAAYYTFRGVRSEYQRSNVDGTKALLDACEKEVVSQFLYCSSTEAMGPTKGIASEDAPLNPEYDYGRSKMMAEEAVRTSGLDWRIVRPTGIYGPGNINDVSYWFITSFDASFATKFIIGSGRNLIQFAHVDDVCHGIIQALAPAGSHGIFNITDERAYSYDEVYAIMSELVGKKPPRTHLPAWLAKALIAPAEGMNKLMGRENFLYHLSTVRSVTTDRAYSIENARTKLGYLPCHPLPDGLRETVQWYREHGYMAHP
ncbi:MAG: NAD-dependent epimerase/dehydratase family protein [Methanomassiliicoccales archaeon]